jgi:pectate lyase
MSRSFARGLLALFCTIGLAGVARAADPLPAFPGAEGHGAASKGGRGGRVIEVTSLADSGPGTLREALLASGPRMIVFRTGGTIELESDIRIRNSDFTLAGQTAPGDGIQIRGVGDSHLLVLERGVQDVIIRYVRLRNGSGVADGGGNDNLTIRSGTNLMIDHVSMSWATDENGGFYHHDGRPEMNKLTLQRSILAEGLRGHSNGLQISAESDYSDPNDPLEGWREVTEISVHHNLFAHNTHRNPRVTSGWTETLNNVTYNWRTRIGSTTKGTVYDYVNNFAKVGPMRIDDLDYVPTILMHHEHQSSDGDEPWPDPSIYTAGNIVEPGIITDPNADNWSMWKLNHSSPRYQSLPSSFRRHTPLQPAAIPVQLETARDAFDSVVADVGANKRLDCEGNWVPNMDRVDERIIADVVNGTGPDDAISSPSSVGGYPNLAAGTPCQDSDHDGMPDAFEDLKSLDKNDSSDGPLDRDNDGYTNLEEYLNGGGGGGGGPLSPPQRPELIN